MPNHTVSIVETVVHGAPSSTELSSHESSVKTEVDAASASGNAIVTTVYNEGRLLSTVITW